MNSRSCSALLVVYVILGGQVVKALVGRSLQSVVFVPVMVNGAVQACQSPVG